MYPDRDPSEAYAVASVVKTLLWVALTALVIFLCWRFAQVQGWV